MDSQTQWTASWGTSYHVLCTWSLRAAIVWASCLQECGWHQTILQICLTGDKLWDIANHESIRTPSRHFHVIVVICGQGLSYWEGVSTTTPHHERNLLLVLEFISLCSHTSYCIQQRWLAIIADVKLHHNICCSSGVRLRTADSVVPHWQTACRSKINLVFIIKASQSLPYWHHPRCSSDNQWKTMQWMICMQSCICYLLNCLVCCRVTHVQHHSSADDKNGLTLDIGTLILLSVFLPMVLCFSVHQTHSMLAWFHTTTATWLPCHCVQHVLPYDSLTTEAHAGKWSVLSQTCQAGSMVGGYITWFFHAQHCYYTLCSACLQRFSVAMSFLIV